MKASNNSPLPKGDLNNQELKTKGTIWKPLITVSLLSVFSFTAGQYLPYVIVAVSGSGAIAAVPLAIFTVSTVIALVLATYLIKLAVSRADNKKEEPQKLVCENCINLENESTKKEFDKSVKQDSGSKTEVRDSGHVPKLTPQQPPLSLGTAIPQNNNAPPTPTPSQVTSGTQPNPSVSVPPPPPPSPPLVLQPPPPGDNSSLDTEFLTSLMNGRKKLKNAGQNSSGSAESSNNPFLEELKGRQKGNAENETPEARAIRIDRELEERKKAKKLEVKQNCSINKNLKKMGFNDTMNDYNDDQNKQNNNDTNGWGEKQDEQNPAVVPSTGAVVLQAKSQQSNAVGTRNLSHGEMIKMTKIQHTEEELNEFSKRRKAMEYSDSESDSDDELSDDERSKNSNSDHGSNNKVSQGAQPSSGSQSLHRKRSESPDSGHGSDDNVKPKSTPPPHSALKAKPPVPLKPVNLQTKPEAPPATTVTEVKSSSTRSVKGLTEMFNNLGGSPVFSS